MLLRFLLVVFLASSLMHCLPISKNVAISLVEQIDSIRLNVTLSNHEKYQQISNQIDLFLIELSRGMDDDDLRVLRAVMGEHLQSLSSRIARQATESQNSSAELIRQELTFAIDAIKMYSASSEHQNLAFGDQIRQTIVKTEVKVHNSIVKTKNFFRNLSSILFNMKEAIAGDASHLKTKFLFSRS
jgi:3-dehydroquinate dehydratase